MNDIFYLLYNSVHYETPFSSLTERIKFFHFVLNALSLCHHRACWIFWSNHRFLLKWGIEKNAAAYQLQILLVISVTPSHCLGGCGGLTPTEFTWALRLYKMTRVLSLSVHSWHFQQPNHLLFQILSRFLCGTGRVAHMGMTRLVVKFWKYSVFNCENWDGTT